MQSCSLMETSRPNLLWTRGGVRYDDDDDDDDDGGDDDGDDDDDDWQASYKDIA